jgi:hypothetical protein
MMHLQIRGFGAHDLDIDLEPQVLLTGANGVGKSTILNALRFAILGAIPALGRTAAATATFLRGREMSVRLTIDTDHWISRTLRRKAKGGFETECRASWISGTRNEEHEAAVLDMFGGSADEIAECLDLNELLHLTPEKRAARLQALLERTQDTGALAQSIARRWMQQLAAVDDERMAEIADHRQLRPLIPGFGGDADDAVHTGQYAAMRELAGQLVPKLDEVGIAGALVWANEQKRQAAAGLRTKKQARTELDLRLAELPTPDADEIARLEGERAALDQQIGAATEREGAQRRRRGLLEQAREAVATAIAAETQAQERREAFEADAPKLPAWRTELADALANLEALTPPAAPDYAEVEALERSARKAAETAAAVVVPDVPDTAAAAAAVTAARAALDRATASPWSRVGAIAAETMAKLEKHRRGWPKVVEQIGAGMTELQTLAAEHGPGDLSACTEALRDAEAALAAAEEQAELASHARGDALARRAELEDAAREGREAAAQARAKLDGIYRAARQEYDAARAGLIATRDRLRPLVDGAEERDHATAEALAEATRAVEAARQRLADVEAATVSEVDPAGMPSAAALQGERDALEERIKTLTRVLATRGEFERLVAEITALEAREVVCKALEAALQRVRAEEIEHRGEPLLSIMREVLAGAGRTETPFLLGWTREDGEQVAVEGLSGGEFVAWAAAFMAALIIRRGAPVKLLLLESAEADPVTLAQVMAGLSTVSDRLRGCILASAHSPAAVPSGWVVRAPGAAATRQAA